MPGLVPQGGEPVFIQNLARRLAFVDLAHTQSVMDVMARSLAEFVVGLNKPQIFDRVWEEITYDPQDNVVAGILHANAPTWNPLVQKMTFLILAQGFTYRAETKTFEYRIDLTQ